MSLNSIISSAAGALSVYEQAISTVQQNTTNANVPAYTALTPNFVTSATGVAIQGVTDARNSYAESTVWEANSRLGAATAQSSNLSILQSQFDVSGSAGVPGALSTAYSAFSAWGANPSDPTVRNQVIQAAGQVASAFNSVAASLQSSEQQVQTQIHNTLDAINASAQKIKDINVQIGSNGGSNPTLNAQLYSELQSLSQFTTVSVHFESNGTATVLINGQVPVVVGGNANTLTASYPTSSTATNPTAPGAAVIKDANGDDITGIVSQGGQLAGLLQVRNQTIPSLIGDQTQQGSLNQLAQGFADRVNTILTSGNDGTNAGKPIFLYQTNSATTATNAGTAVASSLSIDPAFAISDLIANQPATTSPASAAVANGIPNQLAAISNSTNSANQIAGRNFTDFYSDFVGKLGTASAAAGDAKTSLTDQLTQAENLRSTISGVSLNDQAALLQQYQQAYAATSKLVTVVNNLTDSLLALIPS